MSARFPFRRRHAAWSVLVLGCLGGPGTALAQQDAGQILRQLEGTPAPPVLQDAPVIDRRPEPRGEITDVPELVVDITAFRISGAPAGEDEAILALLAPRLGPGKSFQDILDAVGVVREHLTRRGYLLAQAYVPEQRLHGGVVEIAVLAGRLGQVVLNFDEATPVPRSTVEAYLARLRPGADLHTAALERVLFLLNDMHGVSAVSTIRPGSSPGSADLIVDVKPDKAFRGSLQFDNMGSRFTGLLRAQGGLMIGSPLGRGDSLSLRGIFAEDSGINFGSLSYVLPVGADGWRLGASFSNLNYKLLARTGVPPHTGEASDALLFALYPLVRSRNFNVFVQAGYDHKEFVDTPTAGAEVYRRSDAGLVTLSGDLRDRLLGGGINSFSLAYTHGSLDNPTAAIGTPIGQFRRINPYYARLQSIGSSSWLVFLRYAGQFTPDRLDSSEKFSLGGPTAVRAFPVGEAPADRAHVLSAELRYAFPSREGGLPGAMVGALFMDWGHARLDRDPSVANAVAPNNRRILSGFGVGLNWATATSWSAQASLAWPVQGDLVNDRLERRPRAYAQLTHYF